MSFLNSKAEKRGQFPNSFTTFLENLSVCMLSENQKVVD